VRAKVEPEPEGRRVRVATGRIGFDRDIGAWVVPMPSIDPLVVAESAPAPPLRTRLHLLALLGGEQPVRRGGGGGRGGRPLRRRPAPERAACHRPAAPVGLGPTPEQRERAWFKVCFIGEADGTRVLTEVAGGDPGYTETATMIQRGRPLPRPRRPPGHRRQVTTASAMGAVLRARLERAGITFTVAP